MDWRQSFPRRAARSGEPLAKANRHPSLNEIVSVVDVETAPALADIRPWTKSDGKRRLRQIGLP